MVGTKVHVAYEIKDPPLIVKSNDEIEGKIIISNGEKKDKKLKSLYIELFDMYKELVTTKDLETGEETESWRDQKRELKQWDIASGEKLKTGETKEYPFKIKLPTWQKKKGKGKEDEIYDKWHLELHFKQKTSMVASRGSEKLDATCILPIKGSKFTPSFGDVKLAKKQAKQKKAEEKSKASES